MDALTPAAIERLLTDAGVSVGTISILIGLIIFLIRHLLKDTVPLSVYNKTCEQQGKLEQAIARNTDAVVENSAGQDITNKLVEMLIQRQGVV